MHCRGLFHNIYSAGAVAILPGIIKECRKQTQRGKSRILNKNVKEVKGTHTVAQCLRRHCKMYRTIQSLISTQFSIGETLLYLRARERLYP